MRIDPFRNVAELPDDASRRQYEGEDRWHNAAVHNVEKAEVRHEHVGTGHDHACASYCRREDNEKIKIAWHDACSDETKHNGKHSANNGAKSPVEPKRGGESETDKNAARNPE